MKLFTIFFLFFVLALASTHANVVKRSKTQVAVAAHEVQSSSSSSEEWDDGSIYDEEDEGELFEESSEEDF